MSCWVLGGIPWRGRWKGKKPPLQREGEREGVEGVAGEEGEVAVVAERGKNGTHCILDPHS